MATAGGRGAGAAIVPGPRRGGAAAVLLRCEAGGESYCLEGHRVAAIERADRLERDPGEGGRLGWLPAAAGRSGVRPAGAAAGAVPGDPAPEPREGAARGIPVYSLAALLGLPEAPGADGRGPILVIRGGGDRRGLQVDRVARAAGGPGESPLALPEAVRAACGGRFTAALPLDDGRLALVIAPERLRLDGGRADGDGARGEGDAGVAGPDGAAAGNGASFRTGSRSPRPAAPAPVAAREAARRSGAVALFSCDPDGCQGATLFGLSLAQIEEVLRAVPVTPVPGAAGDLVGLVVWRGHAVPVVDLGRRFDPRRPGAGVPAARADGAAPGRLLVARAVRRPEWIAFPVRADLRVEPLPLPSRAWADDPRISPLAALGVFELAAGTVVVPDVDRILTPDRAGPEGGRAARSAAEERGESDEES
jgi:chemotaxis signal transduction protein